MSKKGETNLFVGLDIGTTKVVALVGRIGITGQIDIVGKGSHPSLGLKRGAVVNIEATVQSIKHALAEAEAMAECEIHSVYAGIAGSHIRSLNSHGIVAIRDREVEKQDIDRVIEAAQAVALPSDQKILHILPQEFILDGQEGIREPIGMSGVRLEAKVHIVTGGVSAVQNIVKCIEKCGLHVSDIILQQLASSAAVLTEDEKGLGVCLVDIGGGTTDLAIFTDGAIKYTSVLPVAGDQVTNDIAVALRTTTKQAEELKIRYASVMDNTEDEVVKLTVPGGGEPSGRGYREIDKRFLVNVVGARYEELFVLVQSELKRSRCIDKIGAGLVLTGGASKIDGVVELAERVFQLPVRVGMPQNIGGVVEIVNNPVYATGAGLLLIGSHNYQHGKAGELGFGKRQGVWSKMKTWFQANF